jgi:IMP dehydrogenase
MNLLPRKKIMFRETVCFDDVLLLPQKSDINSREEISLTTSLAKNKFDLPIISSPMDTVTESQMALTMFRRGGLGIVHRYNSKKEQCEIIREIKSTLEEENSPGVRNIAAAIGTSTAAIDRATALVQSGARILCVDVAHGHHSLVERTIKDLKDSFGPKVTIIAGNVATAAGYEDLSNWGADAVRLGIGGGSICSTRIQTGHGLPTLQSVFDCRDISDTAIIADGGIKTAGDIVKALAAGADMVMLGSMLAGTNETPGQVFRSNSNKTYKVYRGMASPEAQIAWRGHARSLEGISTTVPHKGAAENILQTIERNIKSGLSYTGAYNLQELRSKSRFVRQSSSGLAESNTHILLSHGE